MSDTLELDEDVDFIDLKKLDKAELKRLRTELELRQALADVEQSDMENHMRAIKLSEFQVKARFASRGSAEGLFRLDDEVSPRLCDFLSERLDAFVQAHAEDEDKPPITLLINSPGGDMFSGWRLFDELRAASLAGHHVTTVVRGFAASMAAVLAQAGDTRVIGPESWMMIHEPSSFAFGKSFEVSERAAFLERLKGQMVTVFARRSGLTPAAIKRMVFKTDAWFTAAECVKHGFADEIK